MSKKFVFTPEHEVVIARAMIEFAHECGEERTFCPTEVARRVGGERWRSLMPYMRDIAITLALRGHVSIYFKGKPVHPQNFSGIYRLGIYTPLPSPTDHPPLSPQQELF